MPDGNGWVHQIGRGLLRGEAVRGREGDGDGLFLNGEVVCILTSQEIGKSFVSGDR